MKQTFEVTTQAGAWDSHPENMPAEKGIYFVYRCKTTKDPETNRDVSILSKLLYIGESKDMQQRMRDHNRDNDIRTSDIPVTEPLYYTCALLPDKSDEIRVRIEAALIYRHRLILPPGVGNKKNTKTFDYDATGVKIGGVYTYSLDLDFVQERVAVPK